MAAHFLASRTELVDGAPVLLGAPFDGTTSFLPGTRFGPERIRSASWGLETYSPELDRDLEDLAFVDLGDLELPFGNVEAALAQIEAALKPLHQKGHLPVLIGGEHTVTLAGVRAALEAYPDLVVVQFDAHADLRDSYCGEHLSHATVMRRITELIGPDRLYQFGIRSGPKEEFAFGRRNTGFYPGRRVPNQVRSVIESLGERPLYVTVDIDVVDPAFAPGTGTPEPGGWTSGELLEALYEASVGRVVACDVVEVCPLAEHGAITAMLGAKVIREMLLAFTA